jgi:hypothetical protein
LEHLEHEWKQKAAAQAESAYTIYNQATCVEFHRLLIAVLMGYVKALAMLKDCSSAKDCRVWSPLVHSFARLLWQVVGSRAFHLHLEVIADLLTIPSYRSVYTYETFAISQGLHFADLPSMSGQDEQIPVQEDGANEFLASLQAGTGLQVEYGRIISSHIVYFGAISILIQYCN